MADPDGCKRRTLVEIEYGQWGQARPYADSIFEAWVAVREEGLLQDGKVFHRELSQQEVLGICREVIGFYQKLVGDNTRSLSLQRCYPVGPSEQMLAVADFPPWRPGKNCRWYVVAVEPYYD